MRPTSRSICIIDLRCAISVLAPMRVGGEWVWDCVDIVLYIYATGSLIP